MTKAVPRIAKVRVVDPGALRITWKGGGTDEVNLAGWIATGGEILAPLNDPAVFKCARPDEYGAAVAWDDDGDLAIDAMHLQLIAREQHPFGAAEAAAWQEAMGLSNREAAELLHVSLSTWNAYKAGTTPVPRTVAMVCRAAQRDPLLMQAYYRPRRAGRPRKVA
jgi:hypothetical protein